MAEAKRLICLCEGMMGLSCRVVVKTGFVESVSKEVGVKAKSPNERDSQDQDRKKERAIFG